MIVRDEASVLWVRAVVMDEGGIGEEPMNDWQRQPIAVSCCLGM